MTSKKIRFVLAQLNFLVGDIEGNAEKIIKAIRTAQVELHAGVIVFPELALTGYSPEDILLRIDLYDRINHVLPAIKAAATAIDVILGYPEKTVNGCFNKAIFIRHGEIISNYYKQKLPNYSVFDERRYFKSGNVPSIIDIKGIPTAIAICEDFWSAEPMQKITKTGAKLAISINASPFSIHKASWREKTISARAREGQVPILYVNCVGGQDELVFDGGSMALNAQGEVCQRADFFTEMLLPIDINIENNPTIVAGKIAPIMPEEERIYKALVLGVRDYMKKNNFSRAVIGLSGGIDSALTLAIAVDAIGKENVEPVMMPSQFTSELSITYAKEQAEIMGVKHNIIAIEPIFNAFLQSLKAEFTGYTPDVTEENLQARCRGTLLMAISNKKCAMVLATGNKSELSVGYSTLYGDLVGGFCVLKDVYKTLVYRLANYRNQLARIIPQGVIDRAPSAELAVNQKDEDSLPPYSILDAILERYIDNDQSYETIVNAGFDAETVRKIILMVDRNEYKRRQAPIGTRITKRAFGKDRRYPVTSGFSNILRTPI